MANQPASPGVHCPPSTTALEWGVLIQTADGTMHRMTGPGRVTIEGSSFCINRTRGGWCCYTWRRRFSSAREVSCRWPGWYKVETKEGGGKKSRRFGCPNEVRVYYSGTCMGSRGIAGGKVTPRYCWVFLRLWLSLTDSAEW